jgi:hypothetical protein
LQFERVALSATEILHLVHDGLYGSARCREAAIAERHVDILIDREPELHLRLGAKLGGSTA